MMLQTTRGDERVDVLMVHLGTNAAGTEDKDNCTAIATF